MEAVESEGDNGSDPRLPVFPHLRKIVIGAAGLLIVSSFAAAELAQYPALGPFGAAGLFLGLWGLIASLLGFSVTWWQLSKTHGAARAAQRAVGNLKREFRSFDVITELRTAKASAEETRSHIDASRWQEAYGSYNRTRVSLTKMVSVRDGLQPDDLDLARDFITTCVDGAQSAKRLQEDGAAEVSRDILDDRLTELDGFLIKIEYSMKDSIHGR